MNYEELTLAELKKEAKSKGIELNKYDTKETLIGKLNAYKNRQNKRTSKLKNVRSKMLETKKVVVTKANPEDRRESMLISVTNATGSYTYSITFNLPMELPVPIIKNIKQMEYQSWKTVKKGILGNVDVPTMEKAFIVQEVN